MRKASLLLIGFCLIAAVAAYSDNPNNLYSKSLNEFCSEGKRCVISVADPTSEITDVLTTTHHQMAQTNFVYFTNVSYASEATTKNSSNIISLAIIIENVTEDPCADANCWMRVRPESDVPFIDPELFGYYDYSGTTLSLYPEYTFGFPLHTTRANYTVSFETCIVDGESSYNDCMDGFTHKDHKRGHLFKKLKSLHCT
ncbi:MAG: hypothetical protein Harvfovirus1_26 [Harvfovirus sp.]|uniref:Uncharacterized protein n=1 Tax=Harvfovirus sp. TaxID=2487768 RepID=A0A3G5A2I2_9VIRU|nr:MAG: hypothetical protein Harvfovirus1_26 [Harvfovirus sp.]